MHSKSKTENELNIEKYYNSSALNILNYSIFRQSRTLKYEFKPKKGIGIENRLQDSSKDAVSLIKLLLEYNPYQRINAHTALNHRYFKFLQ